MNSSTNLIEEWLSKSHIDQINDFQCEDGDENNHVQLFLQEQALELMEQNLVRTRLFFDQDQNLIGFYSLFNHSIKINKQKRKQLDVNLPHEVKEIPAIRLHYIGIDNRFRELGYGKILMASVLVNCATVAKNSGCTLITLESTRDVIDFYSKFDFIHVHRGDYHLMALNTKGLIKLV